MKTLLVVIALVALCAVCYADGTPPPANQGSELVTVAVSAINTMTTPIQPSTIRLSAEGATGRYDCTNATDNHGTIQISHNNTDGTYLTATITRTDGNGIANPDIVLTAAVANLGQTDGTQTMVNATDPPSGGTTNTLAHAIAAGDRTGSITWAVTSAGLARTTAPSAGTSYIYNVLLTSVLGAGS
jgi:hypothetical protein